MEVSPEKVQGKCPIPEPSYSDLSLMLIPREESPLLVPSMLSEEKLKRPIELLDTEPDVQTFPDDNVDTSSSSPLESMLQLHKLIQRMVLPKHPFVNLRGNCTPSFQYLGSPFRSSGWFIAASKNT